MEEAKSMNFKVGDKILVIITEQVRMESFIGLYPGAYPGTVIRGRDQYHYQRINIGAYGYWNIPKECIHYPSKLAEAIYAINR